MSDRTDHGTRAVGEDGGVIHLVGDTVKSGIVSHLSPQTPRGRQPLDAWTRLAIPNGWQRRGGRRGHAAGRCVIAVIPTDRSDRRSRSGRWSCARARVVDRDSGTHGGGGYGVSSILARHAHKERAAVPWMQGGVGLSRSPVATTDPRGSHGREGPSDLTSLRSVKAHSWLAPQSLSLSLFSSVESESRLVPAQGVWGALDQHAVARSRQNIAEIPVGKAI